MLYKRNTAHVFSVPNILYFFYTAGRTVHLIPVDYLAHGWAPLRQDGQEDIVVRAVELHTVPFFLF